MIFKLCSFGSKSNFKSNEILCHWPFKFLYQFVLYSEVHNDFTANCSRVYFWTERQI
jgi:hypothetical protein